MGLAETIARSVSAGFSALGNVVVSVSYDSYVTAVRDSTNGYTSVNMRRFNIGGVFSRFSHNETLQGGEINPLTDQKFTFLQSRLPVAPSIRDNVHQYESGVEVVWDVIGFTRDPANAIWVIGLRRRSG